MIQNGRAICSLEILALIESFPWWLRTCNELIEIVCLLRLILANVDFAVSWWFKSLGQLRTGTDPTNSIVGARGWLAGWRLSGRRRSDSECIIWLSLNNKPFSTYIYIKRNLHELFAGPQPSGEAFHQGKNLYGIDRTYLCLYAPEGSKYKF